MTEKGKAKDREAPSRAKRAVRKRTLVALGFMSAVALGLVVRTGLGNASSFGWNEIAALCPLGALEVALASRTVVPPGVIGLVVAVVVALVFGRAFCAWVCPVPLLRRVFGRDEFGRDEPGGGKSRRGKAVAAAGHDSESAAEGGKPSGKRHFRLEAPARERGGVSDSRNWVLGGAVIASAVAGFPVFCLVCPVGLTFATFVAVWQLIGHAQVSASLVVFPLVVVLEVVVFRKWCRTICPMGALLSLLSRGNRTFRPVSDERTCLKKDDPEACGLCNEVCPESIDLHRPDISAPLNECIRCGRCSGTCPVHAISFPLFEKDAKKDKAAMTGGRNRK